jgi:UDP-N-acetylmuramyl pentapeptide synthase
MCRKKIAVLDLTHGGIPIAKKLSSLGEEVFGIDAYGTVAPEGLMELEEKYGVHCSKTSLQARDFDCLIVPVHLDPEFPMLKEARALGKKIYSHHEIVGKILKEDSRLFGIKTVEVTGVKAKTSTASLLAAMLSRKYTLVLLSSRGLEAWNQGVPALLYKGLSITPGSILSAVDIAFAAGLKPDFFIFEISIGGTGTADLGILTTLSPDYKIANQSSLASEAKLQLVRNAKSGSILLLNACAKKAIEASKAGKATVLTFRDPFISSPAGRAPESWDFEMKTEASSATDEATEPSLMPPPSGSHLHFLHKGQEIFSVSLHPGYNISAYMTAFVAASAAALQLGIEVESVIASLEEFEGLAGRMREKEFEGLSLIDNSNSGMDILSAEKALEYALLKKKDEKKKGIVLVLGEEASQVCEGLPPEAVRLFVEKHGIKCRHIILVGERMQAVKAKNSSYAENLRDGLSRAVELAGPEDLILSAVKCFR